MKKIVTIGYTVDKEKGYVTGMAMMHQLLIRSLINRFRVKIISLNPKDQKTNRVGTIAIQRYLEYIPLLFYSIAGVVFNSGGIINLYPSIRRAGFYRDSILILLAKLFRCKVVVHIYGAMFSDFRVSLKNVEKNLLDYVYNKIDAIVVEGDSAVDQFNFLREKNRIRIIPNGLPEENVPVVSIHKKYEQGSPFVLFFMNNFIESKGYTETLKAVDILVNEYNLNVKAFFAGGHIKSDDDTLFNTVEEAKNWFSEYVTKHKLEGRVSYVPKIFGDTKVSQFHESHVFMLPSYYKYEGQPVALLEALLYGCVPIVTNHGHISVMVDDDCGVFVQPRSPKSIAESIRFLIQNPDIYEKKSMTCIRKFNENFTADKYGERIRKLFESL